jgi:hypothetical protein
MEDRNPPVVRPYDVSRKFSNTDYVFIAPSYQSMTQHSHVPDIAGVRIPSPMTMEVPVRTKSKSSVFKDDLFSKVSFIFKALSSSGVGNLSLKLEIFSSAGCRFGSILTFAYLRSVSREQMFLLQSELSMY